MEASYEPLKPLALFGKLLALWPRGGSKYARMFYILYECILFSASFVLFLFFKHLYETRERYSPILFVTRLLYNGALALNNLTILFTVLLNKQMINLLNKMTTVDANLSAEFEQTDFKFQYFVVAAYVTTQIPTFPIYVMLFRSVSAALAYWVTVLRSLYCVLFLSAIAHVIRNRYRCINTQLCLLQDSSTSTVLRRFKKLTKAHHQLCDIVDEVNSVFGLQLVTLLLYFVLGFAMFPLRLLWKIKTQDGLDIFDVPRMYFIVKFIFLLVLLTEQCRSAALEGNQAVLLALRLHQRHTNVRILNEIESFSLSMTNNYIRFSVGGFMEIDRHLLFKILLTVTTYLVISLQIEDVEKVETVTTPYVFINSTADLL